MPVNLRNKNAMDWVPADRPAVAPMLDRVPAGSFVLTSGHADLRAGVSVQWVQQCSTTPPMLMVAVRKGHVLSPLIRDSRSFAVCQLDPADKSTPRAFELQTPGIDPVIGSPVDRTPSGCPVPARALGFIDCELARHVDIDGDCEIYVGVVHHASTLLDPRDPSHCLCDGATVQRPAPAAKPAAPVRRSVAPAKPPVRGASRGSAKGARPRGR
jgi:flavin reductase (DIM6/NTAB) family NADH-FMN oxidoreductase RutF